MPFAPPSRLRRALFHLRYPLARAGHPDTADPALQRRVDEAFKEILRLYDLRAGEFERFKAECGYADRYVDYMGPELLDEKLLEHFVSIELLGLKPGQTLVDIGGAESPFAEFAEDRLGCRAYKLDALYKPGIHGNQIGSGAEATPLDTESVDAFTLHCTIDHFEGARDTLFMREAARVLRPGGKVCILPVYFSAEPTIVCDPRNYSPRAPFDAGASVRRVDYANRFGRYYTPETLRARLLDSSSEIEFALFKIEGERAKIPNNYLYYALVGSKKQR